MASIRTLQRSFAGGEVSPEMYGRIDDVKYQSGAATMRNFIAKPQGPAENRPGFAYVNEVKDSTKKTRLIPFTFDTTQTMVIEMSPGYFRFHTNGGTLLSGGSPYQITNPYAEADLFDIHYVQSADVLTLVHPNYPPKELKRLGATNWTLTDVSFAASLSAPTGVTATASTLGVGSSLRRFVQASVGSSGTRTLEEENSGSLTVARICEIPSGRVLQVSSTSCGVCGVMYTTVTPTKAGIACNGWNSSESQRCPIA